MALDFALKVQGLYTVAMLEVSEWILRIELKLVLGAAFVATCLVIKLLWRLKDD